MASRSVNPQLLEIIHQAISQFQSQNPGYTVQVISGYRPGDPRFHGQGKALDVQIYDPSGKAIPNYQSSQNFSIYQQFANTARGIQQTSYPNLNQDFRWGGYFGPKPGAYGANDLMHFDLGGSQVGMKAGSWEHGLNPAFRSYSTPPITTPAAVPNPQQTQWTRGIDIPPATLNDPYSTPTPQPTPSPAPGSATSPDPLPGNPTVEIPTAQPTPYPPMQDFSGGTIQGQGDIIGFNPEAGGMQPSNLDFGGGSDYEGAQIPGGSSLYDQLWQPALSEYYNQPGFNVPTNENIGPNPIDQYGFQNVPTFESYGPTPADNYSPQNVPTFEDYGPNPTDTYSQAYNPPTFDYGSSDQYPDSSALPSPEDYGWSMDYANSSPGTITDNPFNADTTGNDSVSSPGSVTDDISWAQNADTNPATEQSPTRSQETAAPTGEPVYASSPATRSQLDAIAVGNGYQLGAGDSLWGGGTQSVIGPATSPGPTAYQGLGTVSLPGGGIAVRGTAMAPPGSSPGALAGWAGRTGGPSYDGRDPYTDAQFDAAMAAGMAYGARPQPTLTPFQAFQQRNAQNAMNWATYNAHNMATGWNGPPMGKNPNFNIAATNPNFTMPSPAPEVPHLAFGGSVPGEDHGYDEVLTDLEPHELVLNLAEQRQLMPRPGVHLRPDIAHALYSARKAA